MVSAVGIRRFVYTPILPPMLETLGLSRSAAGLIASANFSAILSAPWSQLCPFTRLSPRLAALRSRRQRNDDRRHGADTRTLAIPGAAFVGGAASAFVLIIASTMVLERLTAAGRSDLSSLHFAGVGIGVAVSAALVAAMRAEASRGSPYGWRAVRCRSQQ